MAILWVRADGITDSALTGEMERSGCVQGMLCRKHQQAWWMEQMWGVKGERDLGCLQRSWDDF